MSRKIAVMLIAVVALCLPASSRAAVFDGRVVKDLNGNGIRDGAEPYLQDPAAGCSTGLRESLAGITIRWSGPINGQTTINQCNPEPYLHSGQLPNGDYTVSISLPSGWVSVGASSRTVSLPSNPFGNPWFFVAPLTIVSLTPSSAIRGQATTFTVNGTGFTSAFTAFLVDGSTEFAIPDTQYISATQVKVTLYIGGGTTATMQIRIKVAGQAASAAFSATTGGVGNFQRSRPQRPGR